MSDSLAVELIKEVHVLSSRLWWNDLWLMMILEMLIMFWAFRDNIERGLGRIADKMK